MDFSKVRLADFAHARLRDVAGRELEADSLPSATSAAAEEGVADVCAQAPQYTVTLRPLAREARAASGGMHDVQLDAESGYALAVTSEGLSIWRQGAETSLLFPLPENHSVSAVLVPAAPEMPSVQPGLVVIDRESGAITYWESINRAVAASTNTTANTTIFGTETTVRVPLARKEVVELIEPVAPVGLVVSTNSGHFYLVNMRNDVGKREISVTAMRAGSGIFARLRSMGAFARDIASIRPGKIVEEGSVREVFTINKYGDIALWHVGLNQYAELINETRVGSKLCAQMNILYPNCEVSLLVHDIAIEQNYSHVLASFAPNTGSPLRYFVVMTMSPDLETVVSVRRLRVYESTGQTGVSLQVGNGVLVIASSDAVSMLDSPSRSSSEQRWEESLALKSPAVGSTAFADGSVLVATDLGMLRFVFTSGDRPEQSTTKSRLEQAVFQSSAANPLDLTRWPEFEYAPDPAAPKQLAEDIACSRTPYVPANLPSLREHLNLRAHKLQLLYKQAPIHEVREIAQAVVASAAAYAYTESSNTSSGDQEASRALKAALHEVKASKNASLKDLLINDPLVFPEILNKVASAAKLGGGSAHLILVVLQACNNDGLGIPSWASTGPLRQALESLSSQAADSRDANLLARTTEMLCAVYNDSETTSGSSDDGADCSTIKQLLRELSLLDGMSPVALEIATKYRVFSALAPLEVAKWIEDQSADGLDVVSTHITEYGQTYANAVFETLISSGNVSLLVHELKPRHPTLVGSYLVANNLHSIAWTLSPGTSESTLQLAAATEKAQTTEERRIFASLYKISAYTTRSGDLSEAQIELELVDAQESLAQQFGGSSGGASAGSTSTSAIVRHGVAELSKPLDRATAVDLLALAPPQAIPETNNNFIQGFKLLEPKDTVRLRLLVQQLVCNTNWERVVNSPSSAQQKRLRQTLFYHTWQNVAPAYQAQLQNFRSSLGVSSPVEIKHNYRWDGSSAVVEELEQISQRALSIADKYEVDDLVRQITSGEEKPAEVAEHVEQHAEQHAEQQMDVDG